MKLNWAERWVVNNPSRVIQQGFEVRWMKKAMPLKPGASVLEIGCGRGAGAGLIQQEFRPSVLHAMDLDLDMIRRAKRYLPPEKRQNISLFTGDAMHLPYKDATLDAVFGFGVLHHIPDWKSALAEIARVLKVGGVYFIEELYPSLYQNFITRHILLHPTVDRFMGGELRAALEAFHFSLKDSFEIWKVGILAACIKTG